MRRDSHANVLLPRPRTAALALLGVVLATAGAASGLDTAVAATEGGKPTATQVLQTPRGKPTSGVVVAYTAPTKIAVGETVTVRLHISGVSAAEGASVEVRDLANRTTLLSTRVAAGEARTFELPYTGRSDGMQFIDVLTSQAGRSSVQSLALRVGTGELKLKPEGQRATTSTGEAVISLPAASPGASR